MKKIFLLPAGLFLALGFQSCKNANNDADMARMQHNMDSTVNARLVTLRDSMNMECTKMVMSAAQAHVDSMMAMSANAGAAKGAKGGKTTKPTPVTTPETKNTGNGKLIDKSNNQGGGKLKDRAGVGDTSRSKTGKLKDRMPH